jgi:hypothetical protein
MTRKQVIGLAGTGAALLALLLWFYAARLLFANVGRVEDNYASRLAYSVRWLVLPGFTLLIGVWAAARRGFLPDAIDGTRTPSSYSLEINLRYNQNTVEQVLLAAIAWMGLVLFLPRERLYLIPAMAVSFVVGRTTFWIGYLIHPMGRAFGMVITIIPTIFAYTWLGWQLFQ